MTTMMFSLALTSQGKRARIRRVEKAQGDPRGVLKQPRITKRPRVVKKNLVAALKRGRMTQEKIVKQQMHMLPKVKRDCSEVP